MLSDSFSAYGDAEGPFDARPASGVEPAERAARRRRSGLGGAGTHPRWSAALAVLACLVCVLAVAGVFVLKGTGRLNPTPAAAPPPPPQNRYGAPIPTTPRDVRPLEANVCGALDPAQWTALNIEPAGRPGRAMTGWPTCDWKGVPDPELVRTLGPDLAETSEHVSISATSTNDDLVGVYASHMFSTPKRRPSADYQPWWDRTRPTWSLRHHHRHRDRRRDGRRLRRAHLPDQPANACPKALRIAEAVVARLPPTAGDRWSERQGCPRGSAAATPGIAGRNGFGDQLLDGPMSCLDPVQPLMAGGVTDIRRRAYRCTHARAALFNSRGPSWVSDPMCPGPGSSTRSNRRRATLAVHI